MACKSYFSPETFIFLKELAENNNRHWFQENKRRYEEHFKGPAMCFIADFSEVLRKISRHFTADPRPVGGSLFRIYRDVRFSNDKSPYKTNAGIQFRHYQGKDVHAPGYYLHLSRIWGRISDYKLILIF
ncbi:TIGR02453 family protein [Thermodesulfobacteriota bacterium]